MEVHLPHSPSSVVALGVSLSEATLREGDPFGSLLASPALISGASSPVSKPALFSVAPPLPADRPGGILHWFDLLLYSMHLDF